MNIIYHCFLHQCSDDKLNILFIFLSCTIEKAIYKVMLMVHYIHMVISYVYYLTTYGALYSYDYILCVLPHHLWCTIFILLYLMCITSPLMVHYIHIVISYVYYLTTYGALYSYCYILCVLPHHLCYRVYSKPR